MLQTEIMRRFKMVYSTRVRLQLDRQATCVIHRDGSSRARYSSAAIIFGAMCFALACCTIIFLASPIHAAEVHAKSDAKSEDPKPLDWPFNTVARPAVPNVKNKAVIKNAIDNFILDRLEGQQLSLSEPAAKLALLRRVTLDLTGLPATISDQNAFLKDKSPDAYHKVVDRLLASPRYGEHFADDWFDLVRYAETAGYKIDEERPDAYRYRDYVIRAFNDDLPYDRFVRQQLAGDELEPGNPDALIATGFLRLYPEESNASNFRLCRQNILDDLTEVTGLAFMGMTFGCAKCHDHKFDPILQSDFYELQAFFAPLLPRNDLPIVPPAEKQEFDVKQLEWERSTTDLRQQVETLLVQTRSKAMAEVTDPFDSETQRACLKPSEQRTPLEQQLAALASREIGKKMNRLPRYLDDDARLRYDELQKQLVAFDAIRPAPLPTAMAVDEVRGPAPTTHVLATGNYQKPLKEVSADFWEVLGDDAPAIAPPASLAHHTGRRTALARWLTRPDHPLVARVMVNRIWQHHFGRGLVGTPNDFGVMGESATHPELLDWLAAEFVERRWSIKSMHRLMVLSATYCQSSRVDLENVAHSKGQELDPANQLLWHGRRLRLRGETIRDSVLQVSGEINLRMYGKSSRPELPTELMISRYAWEPDKNSEDRNRRSVYTFTRRNLQHPILAAFDPPDMISSCGRRALTVTAPQALTLLNGKMLLDESRKWAGKLLASAGHDRELLVTAAYREAFGRKPSETELNDAEQFLEEQAEKIDLANETLAPTLLPMPLPKDIKPEEAAAAVDLCHALLNSSEFLFVD